MWMKEYVYDQAVNITTTGATNEPVLDRTMSEEDTITAIRALMEGSRTLEGIEAEIKGKNSIYRGGKKLYTDNPRDEVLARWLASWLSEITGQTFVTDFSELDEDEIPDDDEDFRYASIIALVPSYSWHEHVPCSKAELETAINKALEPLVTEEMKGKLKLGEQIVWAEE